MERRPQFKGGECCKKRREGYVIKLISGTGGVELNIIELNVMLHRVQVLASLNFRATTNVDLLLAKYFKTLSQPYALF